MNVITYILISVIVAVVGLLVAPNKTTQLYRRLDEGSQILRVIFITLLALTALSSGIWWFQAFGLLLLVYTVWFILIERPDDNLT